MDEVLRVDGPKPAASAKCRLQDPRVLNARAKRDLLTPPGTGRVDGERPKKWAESRCVFGLLLADAAEATRASEVHISRSAGNGRLGGLPNLDRHNAIRIVVVHSPKVADAVRAEAASRSRGARAVRIGAVHLTEVAETRRTGSWQAFVPKWAGSPPGRPV